MYKKKSVYIIAGIVAIAVAAGIAYFYVEHSYDNNNPLKTEWVVSGPFAINKPKYKLGENFFISVNGLKPNEAGNILIIQPSGDIWTTIPFNGSLKSEFNYYNKPDTSSIKKIYMPEDLVGTWQMVFEGVPYKPLSFEIINEFIPGAEKDIVPLPIKNKTG